MDEKTRKFTIRYTEADVRTSDEIKNLENRVLGGEYWYN